jgi:hypothetical protein
MSGQYPRTRTDWTITTSKIERVNMFDIFRKYVVGDVVIRRSEDPYTYENFIDESAHSVKRFNALLYEEDYLIFYLRY